MDTRIPLMGQRPQINTPADLLSLRDLQMKVQGQERAIQSQQAMTQAMKEPGMFEEDGTPSTQAVQRAMQLDPKLGEHFLSARNQALQQKALTERAKMLAQARQQTEDLKKKQADLAASKADRERDKRRRELGQEAGMAAVAAYDSIKNAGGTDEAAMQAYRERYREEVDRQAGSGSLAAAGVSDEMINLYFSKLPGPEEIREKYKTNKMREQEQKANLEQPFKEGELGVKRERLSLDQIKEGYRESSGNRKLDQADRGLDIRQQQADTGTQREIDQADAAERKAGISEEQIKERREYGQAVIEIRRLESERKSRWNDMTAEERERHNKAMEAAKEKVGIWGGQKLTKEQVDKGLQGGQKLPMEKLLKEKESEIATLNRELEQGKITQEQHDARMAKITAAGKEKGGELTDVTDVQRNKEAAKHGYMPDPAGGGGYVPIPGGWADPKRIEAIEKAKAAARPGKGGSYLGGQATQEGEEVALTGDEFLAAVEKQNPAYARKIKGIAEGRIKLADVAGNRKEAARMANDVLRYKGDWDERKYSQTSGRQRQGVTLSPRAIQQAAEQALLGGDDAVFKGMSDANRGAIRDKMAEIAAGKNMTGVDVARKTGAYQGYRQQQRTVRGRIATMDIAARELDKFAGQALEASGKVPRTGFKPINELMRLGRNQWSAEQAAFEAYNRSVITAFAQVAARTGAATVHNTEEAEHMLNTAQTPEQYKAVIQALQNDARQAIKAAGETLEDIESSYGKSSEGTTRPKGASSPSQGAAPGGSPGPKKDRPITATGPDGKKLMLKDGKWVPMQ